MTGRPAYNFLKQFIAILNTKIAYGLHSLFLYKTYLPDNTIEVRSA
jgi:hypothetical protein